MTPYYDHAGITIYHGDCIEILPTLDLVDLVMTDPPYGIGAYSDGVMGGGVLARQSTYDPTTWDSQTVSVDLMADVIAHGTRACIWGGNYYSMAPSSSWLVWDKENGANYFADAEVAWTNYGGAVRIKRHRWQGMIRKGRESRYHPTQKPLDVIKWATLLCPGEPRHLLDPFMGSGTTLRAAKDLGRKAIGIEIEEKYCEIAAKRMAQEVLL